MSAKLDIPIHSIGNAFAGKEILIVNYGGNSKPIKEVLLNKGANVYDFNFMKENGHTANVEEEKITFDSPLDWQQLEQIIVDRDVCFYYCIIHIDFSFNKEFDDASINDLNHHFLGCLRSIVLGTKMMSDMFLRHQRAGVVMNCMTNVNKRNSVHRILYDLVETSTLSFAREGSDNQIRYLGYALDVPLDSSEADLEGFITVLANNRYFENTVMKDREMQKLIEKQRQIESTEKLEDLLKELVLVIHELRDALGEMKIEFHHAPIIMRPFLKGEFKSKAGLSVSEFYELLDELIQGDSWIENTLENKNKIVLLKRVNTYMAGLIKYFKDVPVEAKKHIKKQDELEKVLLRNKKREKICSNFLALFVKLVKVYPKKI